MNADQIERDIPAGSVGALSAVPLVFQVIAMFMGGRF
jgi:hypothetical protein